jgi:hypothetical protein
MEMRAALKPDLQFSVLCDDVRREDNGKLMLIGLFELIAGLHYPMSYPGMAVVNRWTNGVGEYQQKVRMVDGSNTVVVETLPSPVVLPDSRAAVTAVSLMRNIPVAKPGRYWIEVLLDGDLKTRYSLTALQLDPDGRPLPPAGAEP